MRMHHWIVAVWVLAATAAHGQQADRKKDPGAMDALKRLEAARPGDVSREELASVVDKSRIAREDFPRLVGLRELGNPHIQRGEGLLLPEIQDDPSVSRVDLDDLHERQIALVERREPVLSPKPAAGEQAQTGSSAALAATTPSTSPAVPAAKRGGFLTVLGVSIAGAVVLGALWFLLRR